MPRVYPSLVVISVHRPWLLSFALVSPLVSHPLEVNHTITQFKQFAREAGRTDGTVSVGHRDFSRNNDQLGIQMNYLGLVITTVKVGLLSILQLTPTRVQPTTGKS